MRVEAKISKYHDVDIAARAEEGIKAEIPTLLAPLSPVVAPAMERPPRQRRYINGELRTLLASVKHLELFTGDDEAFALLEKYERKLHMLYVQTRKVQLIKDVLNKKMELHRQWMMAV